MSALSLSGAIGDSGPRGEDAQGAAQRSEDGGTSPDVQNAKYAKSGRSSKRGLKASEDDAEAESVTRWRSPHYAAWTPAPVYGPPCPPERMQARRQAHRLLEDMAAGRLQVMMNDRDGEQLRLLEQNGVYGWPAPPSGVTARSPRQRDVLAGTLEEEDASQASHSLPTDERNYARNNAASSTRDGLTLASRGLLPRRNPTVDPILHSTVNPADDPDFDPCVLPPAPGLLRMLTTLAAHSTPARPLCVMSLLRPPYRMGGFVHVGPANPHSLGLAVDIAAYGGYGIRQAEPEQCVAATLSLLRDLPPGRYRLGMPKALESGWELPPALSALLTAASPPCAAQIGEARTGAAETGEAQAAPPVSEATGCAIAALYGLHASSAKPAWPFFPPPYMGMAPAAPPEGRTAFKAETEPQTSARSGSRLRDESASLSGLYSGSKPILRFQNEAYAPENALADIRLRRALQRARQRGVDVMALFPDGADHIHIDVRQNP